MEVTRADVLRCAELAHLNLEEAELEPMRLAMAQMLSHAQSLDQLDLEGVEPSTHGMDLPLHPSGEEPVAGVTQAEALAGAPQTAQGYFLVPKVL